MVIIFRYEKPSQWDLQYQFAPHTTLFNNLRIWCSKRIRNISEVVLQRVPRTLQRRHTGLVVSQITGNFTVFSTFCSSVHTKISKLHVTGPSPHKGPATRKTFPYDVIIFVCASRFVVVRLIRDDISHILRDYFTSAGESYDCPGARKRSLRNMGI